MVSGPGPEARDPDRPLGSARCRIAKCPSLREIRVAELIGTAGNRGERQPSVRSHPWAHPVQRLLGLCHRLGDHPLAGMHFEPLGSSEQRDRIVQAQISDRSALKMVAALARLHESHQALRPTDREREPRDSGSGAQICDGFGRWQDLAQCRRLEQQALGDCERAAVAGQIDALAPAIEQQRKLFPAVELARVGAEP